MLYDLTRDPGEQIHLASREPVLLARLRRALEARRRASESVGRSHASESQAGSPTLSAEARRRLRALGYLD